MELTFNTPLNRVSFGQMSICLLREAFENGDAVSILPLADQLDLSSQSSADEKFLKWIEGGVKGFPTKHRKDTPTIKVWHLEEKLGFYSVSDNQALFSFYELDSPTELEVSAAKHQRHLIVSSKYTKEVFEAKGVHSHYVPLGFDKYNFNVIDKLYHDDGRIVFNLCGKFEHRKRHAKILQAWAKKYGNDKRYALQCAIFNPFMDPKINNDLISGALEGLQYFNISFLPMMQTNDMYNDFLNSAQIVIGMSGGEGWGLPEFQSVCLGKHSVMLDAHGYQGWANSENSVLVSPTGKVDATDGLFFKKGSTTNQGQIFDWDVDDFLSGCDEAIKRVSSNKINDEGLKLQDSFSYKNTYDGIIKVLKG